MECSGSFFVCSFKVISYLQLTLLILLSCFHSMNQMICCSILERMIERLSLLLCRLLGLVLIVLVFVLGLVVLGGLQLVFVRLAFVQRTFVRLILVRRQWCQRLLLAMTVVFVVLMLVAFVLWIGLKFELQLELALAQWLVEELPWPFPLLV